MIEPHENEALSWDAVYALVRVAGSKERLDKADLINAMKPEVREELLEHGMVENRGGQRMTPESGWRLLPAAADVVQAYIYAATQAEHMKRQPPDPNARGACQTCRRVPISGETWS